MGYSISGDLTMKNKVQAALEAVRNRVGAIKSSLHFFAHLSAGQYQPSAEGFPIGKGYNACAVCQRVYIGSAGGVPIGVKR